MNARFRTGFITAFSRIPGLSRYLKDSRINTHHHSDIPGMALAGNLIYFLHYLYIYKI